MLGIIVVAVIYLLMRIGFKSKSIYVLSVMITLSIPILGFGMKHSPDTAVYIGIVILVLLMKFIIFVSKKLRQAYTDFVNKANGIPKAENEDGGDTDE